jgi:hypothetical protein
LRKYQTEESISEKLGLAIDNPDRAAFLSLQMKNWLLRKNQNRAFFGILESSAIQWCKDATPT